MNEWGIMFFVLLVVGIAGFVYLVMRAPGEAEQAVNTAGGWWAALVRKFKA